MEQSPYIDEAVISEGLTPEIAPWQRERTREELLGFIASKEAIVFGDTDHDDIDSLFSLAA